MPLSLPVPGPLESILSPPTPPPHTYSHTPRASKNQEFLPAPPPLRCSASREDAPQKLASNLEVSINNIAFTPELNKLL